LVSVPNGPDRKFPMKVALAVVGTLARKNGSVLVGLGGVQPGVAGVPPGGL
jgi:hypothetical protein